MEILHKTTVLTRLCKEAKKYGMYVSFSEEDQWVDVISAAPYLKDKDQIIVDCEGWLLFDTEEEMNNYYNQTVGDDGPTELNNYDGPARVYALTCNLHGQLENENTQEDYYAFYTL